MTLSEIMTLIRNIVVFWPYEQIGRVNTFSTFKTRAELTQTTFGRSYRDYLQGSFWARSWVKNGASRTDMAVDYGAIAVEHKRGTLLHPETGKVEQSIFINSIQLMEQNGEALTEDELAALNEGILLKVLKELFSVAKYRVTPAAGSPYLAFLSHSQALYMEALPDFDQVGLVGSPLMAYLTKTDSLPINQVFYGVDEWRASSVNLIIRTCEDPEISLTYQVPDSVQNYVVICK